MHFVGYLHIKGLIKACKMEHIKIHRDINTKRDFLPPNIYSNIHVKYQYQVYYPTFSPNIATPKYGVPLLNYCDGICVCERERERVSASEYIPLLSKVYHLTFTPE